MPVLTLGVLATPAGNSPAFILSDLGSLWRGSQEVEILCSRTGWNRVPALTPLGAKQTYLPHVAEDTGGTCGS